MRNVYGTAFLTLAAALAAGCAGDPAAAVVAPQVALLADGEQSQMLVWDDYVMTDLGDLGGAHNVAVDINDAGQIIGVSTISRDANAISRAWVHDGTTLTPLPLWNATAGSSARALSGSGDVLGSNGTQVLWTGGTVQNLRTTYPTLVAARDLNDAGTIVGACRVPRSIYNFACVLNAGTTTLLDTTGYRYSSATAINHSGVVVGSRASTGRTQFGAFVWTGGSPLTLPPLGQSTHAEAVALNDAGTVVGRSTLYSNWRATLWRNGVAVDLGAVHGNASWALGISNGESVVGLTIPIINGTPGNYRPFLWRNGRMRLLPTGSKRIEQGEARAVNGRGEIVGFVIYPNKETRAVVWRKP